MKTAFISLNTNVKRGWQKIIKLIDGYKKITFQSNEYVVVPIGIALAGYDADQLLSLEEYDDIIELRLFILITDSEELKKEYKNKTGSLWEGPCAEDIANALDYERSGIISSAELKNAKKNYETWHKKIL